MPTTLDWTHLETCYEEYLYLDAYKASKEYWSLNTIPDVLDAEKCVFAGRLAGKLGGTSLSRALFAEALKKDPGHPAVRIYAKDPLSRPRTYLEHLEEYNRKPVLEKATPDQQMVWRAGEVFIRTNLRDFKPAEDLLEELLQVHGPDSWLLFAKANLLLRKDQWDAALEITESLYEQKPLMHHNLALIQEISVRRKDLSPFLSKAEVITEQVQNFDTLDLIAYALLSQAERSEDEEKEKLLQRAEEICTQMPLTAPLADRRLRERIAIRRMDLGWAKEDAQLVGDTASSVRSQWYQRLAGNLKKNAQVPETRVHFSPVWQGRNTCLPCSVCTLFPEVDLQNLSGELTYGGTPLIPCMEWLRETAGLHSIPFIVKEGNARNLLSAGFGFIMLSGGDNWAHATAAVGFDDQEETLLVHDPSNHRLKRIFWEDLKKGEAAFGPQGIVLVKEKRLKEAANKIETSNRIPFRIFLEIQQRGTDLQYEKRLQELTAAEKEFPGHPVLKRARALIKLRRGQPEEAIQDLDELLKLFPKNRHLRLDLLNAIHSSRNTRRQMDLYASLATQGTWGEHRLTSHRMDPVYLARHADMLTLSADGVDRAMELLRLGLIRFPMESELWHILGDVFWRRGDVSDTTLPLRIASCLNETQEHYARAVVDSYAANKALEEGLLFLRNRTASLGSAQGSGAARMTECQALWDYGKVEEAVHRLEQALEELPDDPSLILPAVSFWLDAGELEKAEILLPRVKKIENRVHSLICLADFANRTGKPEEEEKLLKECLEISPDNYTVISSLVTLLSGKDGCIAAMNFLNHMVERLPGNEDIENLQYDWLDYYLYRDKARELLEHRLKERTDPWAIRQWIHSHIKELSALEGEKQRQCIETIRTWMPRLKNVTFSNAEFLLLESRWLYEQGKPSLQLEHLYQVLKMDAGRGDALYDLCAHVRALPLDSQREVLQKSLSLLKSRVSESPALPEFFFTWVGCFGVESALKEIKDWRNEYPNTRVLIDAELRLLIQQLRGVNASRQALELLDEAWLTSPWDGGLIEMRITALEQLDDMDSLENFCMQVLIRYPLHILARQRIAFCLVQKGEIAEALDLMRQGCRMNPGNREICRITINLLNDFGTKEEAIDMLSEECRKRPRDIGFSEYLMELFMASSRKEEALLEARRLYQEFPGSAYPAYLLATMLEDTLLAKGTDEIEKYYREALQLNPELEPACDRLAVFLVFNGRSSEASDLVNGYLEKRPDAVDIATRKAWLLYRENDRSGAIRELRTLVRSFPHYEKAWKILCNWIVEKKNLKLAKEVFEDIPPELSHDLDWRLQRLQTLEDCGVPIDSLDKEWELLLQEHPTNLRLMLHYADRCIDQGVSDRAREMIARYLEIEPGSPFGLTRQVQLEIRDKNIRNALKICFMIWSRAGTEYDWCDRNAWESLKLPDMKWRLLWAFRSALKNDGWIKPPVVENILEAVPACSVRYLNRILMKHTFRSQYLYAVIDNLIEQKKSTQAWQVWKKCTSAEKENPRLWACGIRTTHIISKRMVSVHRIEKLLQGWESRPGVEMWAMTNAVRGYAQQIQYYNCSPRRGVSEKKTHLVKRQVELCEASLERLQYDWTAQYMLLERMLGYLALGRFENMLQSWKRDNELLMADTKEQGFWSSPETSCFQKVLPELMEALEEKPVNLEKLCRIFQNSSLEEKAPRGAYRSALKHLAETENRPLPKCRMKANRPRGLIEKIIGALLIFWAVSAAMSLLGSLLKMLFK